MEVKSKNKNCKFQPVTLEVTFESMEEIQNMWHRLHLHDSTIRAAISNCSAIPCPDAFREFQELWNIIDYLARDV